MDKEKAVERPARNRDIKCFKCHGMGHYASECTNKKVMVLMENGEVETEDEEELEPVTEQHLEEIEEPPVQGQLLVTRRTCSEPPEPNPHLAAKKTLSVQPKNEELDQRENLFHSRCKVHNKVCSLIIDGGSCTNVASESMVQKLGLETSKHPRPYPLQWLNETGELQVTHQVQVPLEIGNYKDQILCDVLPMEAGHILLGRPWQTDRRVTHDGYTNRHHFVLHGRKITLVPMSPQEVYLDQLHLKQQRKKLGKEKVTKTKTNFFIKANDDRKSLHCNLSMFSFKDYCLSSANPEPVLPSKMNKRLQDFKDIIPEEYPDGLPPSRGQVDVVHGTTLSNRPAYKTNHFETKEIQQQVDQLMPKIDNPFNVVKRINDNKLDLQGKYSISANFHSSYLVPFVADGPDLRPNLLEEGGDDTTQDGTEVTDDRDHVRVYDHVHDRVHNPRPTQVHDHPPSQIMSHDHDHGHDPRPYLGTTTGDPRPYQDHDPRTSGQRPMSLADQDLPTDDQLPPTVDQLPPTVDQPKTQADHDLVMDPMVFPTSSMTRARRKTFQQALQHNFNKNQLHFTLPKV